MTITPPPVPESDDHGPDQDFVARNGRSVLLLIGVLFCLAAVSLVITGHPIVGDALAWTGIVAIIVAIVEHRLVSLGWRDFQANLREDDR